MPYCSGCGQAIQDGVRFCPSCGVAVGGVPSGVSTVSSAAAVSPTATPVNYVVVVEPKRGGRLTLKAILITIILALAFTASLTSTHDQGLKATGNLVAFGIGAIYIISSLRKWKRQNNVVHNAGIGWAVAILMLFVCLSAIVTIHGANAAVSSSSSLGGGAVDAKEVLLRDLKLDYKWRKEGFGNVMKADFTLTNPTPYRFKDFEIKCTHYASSGTEIDSNTRTVYEIVEPKSTKLNYNTDMGFIHSQAARSGCEITDLTVLE